MRSGDPWNDHSGILMIPVLLRAATVANRTRVPRRTERRCFGLVRSGRNRADFCGHGASLMQLQKLAMLIGGLHRWQGIPSALRNPGAVASHPAHYFEALDDAVESVARASKLCGALTEFALAVDNDLQLPGVRP